MIELKCDYCRNKFKRTLKEYTRNKKEETKIFCNNSCGTSYRNEHMPKSYWKTCWTTTNLKKYANNRQDELSPFRAFLNSGRATFKKHKININSSHLKKIWESQKGICPYTGIEMILPRNTLEYNRTRSLKKASLDRIDSSKEYSDGNVEFVCMAVNNAKNSFTKNEMKEFLRSIDFSVTHS